MMFRPMTYKGRVGSQDVNDVYAGLNRTCKLKQALGGAGSINIPALRLGLWFHPCHTYDDLVCRPGATPYKWVVQRGRLPKYTIRGLETLGNLQRWSAQKYDSRCWFFNTGGGNMYEGYADLRDVSQGDYFYGEGWVIPPFLAGAAHFNGTTRTYDWDDQEHGSYGGSAFRGVSDPCEEGQPDSVFAEPNNHIPWGSSDYDMGAICVDESWWGSVVGNPTHVGWNYGQADGLGIWQDWPINAAAGEPAGNTVGCGSEGGGDIEAAMERAGVNASPIAVGHNRFLKHVPKNAVIHSATIEVTSAGMQRTHLLTTRTSHTDPGTVTNTVTTEGISLVLVGRYIDGAGNVRCEPVGVALGGDLVNGKRCVVDATGLYTALQGLRDSIYKPFGLVPGFVFDTVPPGTADARGILKGMCAQVDWEYYADPEWEEDWMGGGDAVWESRREGSYVTWSTVQLGDAVVDFSLPSGEGGRVVYNTAIPDMADVES